MSVFTRVNAAKAAVVSTAVISSSAMAADYTSLVTAVDLSGATTAVISVFGAVAGIAVAIMGGRKVLQVMRG